MTHLKIAFITSTFPSPDKPSQGIFNLRAAKDLSSFCDLTVYKLRTWRPGRKIKTELNYEGIRVKIIAIPIFPFNGIVFSVLNCYLSYFYLRSEIKKQQFNILYSSGIHYSGFICSLVSSNAHIKHIAQVIGSDVNFELPKLIRLNFSKIYYKGIFGILSVCKDLEQKVKNYLPEINNTEIAYRGIDILKFTPTLRIRKDDKTQFLFLGGFPKGSGEGGINLKGGVNLTTIWKENEGEFNTLNFRLVIGGVYSNENWIIEWKNSLKYPENIKLVGNLKSEDAREQIIESDIVLLPSLYEGLPNIAVESAALERVVLGSKVNGVPEIIIDKITGILLPPNDLSSWKDAMIKYGSDKKLLADMGENARKWVCKNFDSRNFAPTVIRFFEKVYIPN